VNSLGKVKLKFKVGVKVMLKVSLEVQAMLEL